MPRVIHLLPHPGGGGETYVDLLEQGIGGGWTHSREVLARQRTPLAAAPGLLVRRPFLARLCGRVDLVHMHGDMAAMLGRGLNAGRPVVITTHGLHFVRRASGPVAGISRTALRRAIEHRRRRSAPRGPSATS